MIHRVAVTALAVLVTVTLALPAHAEQTIRVRLEHDKLRAVVAAEHGMEVLPLTLQMPAPVLAPEMTTVLDLQSAPGGLLIAGAIFSKGPIAISPLQDAVVFVEGKPYRGAAVVEANLDGTLSVINIVALEDYLYGVVPAEMPAFWPSAALQAQAIAARSYALARSDTNSHPDYDVEAGEKDQVYGGITAEIPASSAAVDATRGLVLVSGGQVATAYFSACDGGQTATGDVLEDPEPYLVSKPDPYCDLSPYMHWTASVPLATFTSAFEKVFAGVGTITGVSVAATDDSGRVQSVNIGGTTGGAVISGSNFRLFAGERAVKSLRITSLALKGDQIVVSGAGFGHGAGMCQYGARGMALAGFDAASILRFYYPGAGLTSLVER